MPTQYGMVNMKYRKYSFINLYKVGLFESIVVKSSMSVKLKTVELISAKEPRARGPEVMSSLSSTVALANCDHTNQFHIIVLRSDICDN